jgi:LPS export ABC transporter permease LptG/LPS export ABC transporter permease LptF
MRLTSRSVLREIWPPFLLGFAAYTFILLIRTVYFLADFFVRRSASFGEVAWLAVLSLPWIVVLTLPMAFLLAVLIGVGRLAGDSEIIALRSCGIGPMAVYRPAMAAAGVLSVGVFLLYNLVLPGANDRLTRSLARVAATSVVNVVHPRTFREARSGVTLYFDHAGPDGRSLEGVFVKLGEEWERDQRVIVARRGALTLEGERLWLDLFQSTLHEYDPADPAHYRLNRAEAQRVLLAGDIAISSASVSYEKGLRAQSLGELLETARRMERESPENFRLAWVEIHKKFSIPFACLAFAVIGIPLAESARRGGRGSAFAISLAIIILYYVLLSAGETWGQQGRLPPGAAIWIPNVLLLAGGALAIARSGREHARWQWKLPLRWRPSGRPVSPTGSRPRFGGLLRFPGILDRYVLRRFLTVLVFAAVSVLVLAVIVDYAERVDRIAKNHPPGAVVLGYYRCFLLSIAMQIAPFVSLIATLVCLGILSKNNEDTAFRASGVSLHRLAAPILAATAVAALLFFALEEYVVPYAERQQARYYNIINGRPEDYGAARTPAERNWRRADDGSIWHQEESDPSRGVLVAPSVFRFSDDFDLVRREAARFASWDGSRWIFRQGWSRTFGESSETGYRTYLEDPVPGEPPRNFARERRTPEQMRWREVQRYARRLKAGGYATGDLETAMHGKFSIPALIPMMALLGVPFAFRIGRRGALAGIGVGLALGMGFLIAVAFFTKLGDVGALPAVLAAWSPNVLAATLAVYLLLRLRT